MPADWLINQRVRFYSDHEEREPVGTVIHVDNTSDHVTVEWDDGHKPTLMDFSEANRKLERI